MDRLELVGPPSPAPATALTVGEALNILTTSPARQTLGARAAATPAGEAR